MYKWGMNTALPLSSLALCRASAKRRRIPVCQQRHIYKTRESRAPPVIDLRLGTPLRLLRHPLARRRGIHRRLQAGHQRCKRIAIGGYKLISNAAKVHWASNENGVIR